MKKIITLQLHALVNAKHFNLMQFVATAIGMFSVLGERFAAFIAAFTAAFNHENDVYLHHDRTFYNADIAKADADRDVQFRVLRDAIKTAQLLSDEGIKSAAGVLLKVIELYGGVRITNLAMDAESGILTNLVEDFELKYNAEVATLNIGQLVAKLKEANNRFIQLMSDRTLNDSKFGKQAMVKARRETDKAYRAFVQTVNLEVYLNRGADLQDFISYLNAELERYRIQLGQGSGDKEEDEGLTAPDDEPESPKPENPAPENPTPENPDTPTNPDDNNQGDNSQGGSTGGGNTNPGGGYVPPSNGGGFD